MARKKATEDALEELVAKLKEVAPTLEKLPPEVRSQAFDLLKPFIRGTSAPKDDVVDESPEEEGDDELTNDSMEDFFGKFEHDKPKDNVTLIAAWHYSQHGLEALTTTIINQIAGKVGVTVPSRPDMTLRQKAVSGKSCFQNKGRGYAPTVHGEAYLKTTYKVKKGNKPMPTKSKT